MLARECCRRRLPALFQVERRANGSFSMVLVHNRRAKERHHTLARYQGNMPLVGIDSFGQELGQGLFTQISSFIIGRRQLFSGCTAGQTEDGYRSFLAGNLGRGQLDFVGQPGRHKRIQTSGPAGGPDGNSFIQGAGQRPAAGRAGGVFDRPGLLAARANGD